MANVLYGQEKYNLASLSRNYGRPKATCWRYAYRHSTSINNMANVLAKQKKYDEVRPFYPGAMAGWRQVREEKHDILSPIHQQIIDTDIKRQKLLGVIQGKGGKPVAISEKYVDEIIADKKALGKGSLGWYMRARTRYCKFFCQNS